VGCNTSNTRSAVAVCVGGPSKDMECVGILRARGVDLDKLGVPGVFGEELAVTAPGVW